MRVKDFEFYFLILYYKTTNILSKWQGFTTIIHKILTLLISWHSTCIITSKKTYRSYK